MKQLETQYEAQSFRFRIYGCFISMPTNEAGVTGEHTAQQVVGDHDAHSGRVGTRFGKQVIGMVPY